MSDGANMGVSAGRALQTIVGGEPAPDESERVSMAELEKRIRSRPLPLDGPGPWERVDAGEMSTDDAYSSASEIMAHAFLVLEEEKPGVLDQRLTYNKDNCPYEELHGQQMSPETVVWEAYLERWPGADEWIGGASGFMVGWAFNAAREIKGLGSVGNPAIVRVG